MTEVFTGIFSLLNDLIRTSKKAFFTDKNWWEKNENLIFISYFKNTNFLPFEEVDILGVNQRLLQA